MGQLTLRISDELAAELKAAAGQRSMSVNRFASAVLAAAVDPDLGETELERLRGRLARAGLLEVAEAPSSSVRPDPGRVAEARSRAGRGRSLSDLVSEGRD